MLNYICHVLLVAMKYLLQHFRYIFFFYPLDAYGKEEFVQSPETWTACSCLCNVYSAVLKSPQGA